jgi:hypothetical protein
MSGRKISAVEENEACGAVSCTIVKLIGIIWTVRCLSSTFGANSGNGTD